MDETSYLLASPTNRERLLRAYEQVVDDTELQLPPSDECNVGDD